MARKCCMHAEFAMVVIAQCCPFADDLFKVIDEKGGEPLLHALGTLLADAVTPTLQEMVLELPKIAEAAKIVEMLSEADNATKH